MKKFRIYEYSASKVFKHKVFEKYNYLQTRTQWNSFYEKPCRWQKPALCFKRDRTKALINKNNSGQVRKSVTTTPDSNSWDIYSLHMKKVN